MVKHYETPQEKEQYLTGIRAKALKDVETVGTKQRFGLFSQPPPLAVSDNSYDHVCLVKKDENGKPITQPRNPQTNPGKKGKIKSSYFSNQGYITIGDKYQDEYKLRKLYEMQNKSKIPKDIPEFKYSDGYKLVVKHPYEHKTDYKKVVKEIKDENGRVIVQPRNPQTGPNVKGLYKQPQHMKEEYNRYAQLVTKERDAHHAKIKDLPPFKSMDKDRQFFNSVRDVYFNDPSLKQRVKKPLDLKSLHHDAPFKPSHPPKKGYNNTLEKYPEYKPDPIREAVRKIVEEGEVKKDVFKLNNPVKLDRPTPSVSFHPVNIKREMRSSMR